MFRSEPRQTIRPAPRANSAGDTDYNKRVEGQAVAIVHAGVAEHGGHFYLLAERECANWVRNIQSQPQVKVRVGDAEFNAIARIVHK
jgi:hypothetical protein